MLLRLEMEIKARVENEIVHYEVYRDGRFFYAGNETSAVLAAGALLVQKIQKKKL